MKTGLLWYDDNPDTTLEDKIRKAATRYRQKFGQTPNVCYVRTGTVETVDRVAGLEEG